MRLLAALLLMLPTVVSAQGLPMCKPYEQFASWLYEEYGESVVGRGQMMPAGGVLNIWADPTDGSWTVSTTDSSGMTCLRAEGMGFETVEPVPPGAPV